jgi:serine/threonine protein kinase
MNEPEPEDNQKKTMIIATNYRVPELCMRDILLKRELGRGISGTVFKACKGDQDCRYVVKMVPFWEPDDKDKFLQEVEMTKFASRHNIAPHFHDAWICPGSHNDHSLDIGFMLSDKYNITLAAYMQKVGSLSVPVCKGVMKLIKKMHSKGMIHADLHNQNVMMKMSDNNNITDVRLIDFGFAFLQSNPLPVEQLQEILERRNRPDLTLEPENREELIEALRIHDELGWNVGA